MGEVTGNNHKVVFMFEFAMKVNEITANKEHFSSKCVVGDLGWRIVIERKVVEDDSDDGEFEYVNSDRKGPLAVKVNCDGESQSKLWCSYARIRLSLISRKDGMENYSREFENLFSAMNPTCEFPEFMEWDKVIDPANGYVAENVVTFQAHVVANVPQYPKATVSKDITPEEAQDWLALFEGNLNEKIVGRICSEFVRMNTVIKKALTNSEISEKIIAAAVDPIKDVIHSEVQALEKKLEKFCANHIAKVVRELKNVNVRENSASGSEANEIFEGRSDYESKKSFNGNDTNQKKAHPEEETVPLSVLKMMKEVFVEQQRTSFGAWIPSLYGRAAYYRSNEVHSYQPDSIREAEEFRLQKGTLPPLPYDNSSDSFDASRQSEETVANSETKRENDSQFSGFAPQQQRKIEKSKNDEVFVSKGDEMSAKVAKPITVPEKTPVDQLDKEIMFVGKTEHGEPEVHIVQNKKQLLELKKKFRSFKTWNSDEF